MGKKSFLSGPSECVACPVRRDDCTGVRDAHCVSNFLDKSNMEALGSASLGGHQLESAARDQAIQPKREQVVVGGTLRAP